MGKPSNRLSIPIGERFGKLVYNGGDQTIRINGTWKRMLSCDCDCGVKNHAVSLGHLRSGDIKSCGCVKKNERKNGSVFGHLTLINKIDKYFSMFECCCGLLKKIRHYPVFHGVIKSCGCIRKPRKCMEEKTGIHRYYKKHAHRRNKEFLLSEDEVFTIVQDKCFYCKQEPSIARRIYNKNNKVIVHGIDRVDNSLGYTIGNSVPCCWLCNRMKSNLNINEFYEHIKKIYSNMQEITVY